MNDLNLVLGLDLGDRHIGVAIGNLVTKTATPLPDFANDRFLSEHLLELKHQYSYSKIIVGLPLTATGKTGEQVSKVMELVNQLRAKLLIEIILEDERFTTQSATKFLTENPQNDATIDGISAKLILESWLARQ
jgi:putative holliday junction resolvase